MLEAPLRQVLIPILIVIAWAATGAASAATKELTKSLFAAIPWNENAPDVEARRRFADAIEAYWKNFNSRVPRLSPNERERIEAEMSAQDGRLERALNSKEFAIWSINRHADLCLEIIHSVVNSFESEQSQQLEMFYWLKMVNCYDGTNDLTLYLDRAGIPYNDDEGRNIQIPVGNIMQGIIVNKVAPMAMAETMDWSFGK